MPSSSLILSDGTILTGQSFGAHKNSEGEVVFNTGMMGYPESFTDPSYKGQILTLTYPLIGNYGVPAIPESEAVPVPYYKQFCECKPHYMGKDKEFCRAKQLNNIDQESLRFLGLFESEKIHLRGVIVSEYSENFSHFNAKKSLGDWLKEFKIPGITSIDTRALTQKIREKGTMLGKIVAHKGKTPDLKFTPFRAPDMDNVVAEVSIKKPITYHRGRKHVALIDTGCKTNIIREFLKRNITVTRFPWDMNPFNQKTKFHGVFFSNGPGDPMIPTATHETMRLAMAKNIPTFGICLGSQIMGIAEGAKTYKLKYGHRAQNQPCTDLETGRCYITSQNHGYAIDPKTLPKDWKVWFINQNDKTIEGIKHKSKPFFSVQFHPESTPGPVDTLFLFDKFINLL